MTAGEAELAILVARLGDRVAEGRYREAEGVLQEYCRALRETVAGMAPGDPGWRRLEGESRRVMEGTRRGVLAGRAHAGVRLAALSQASRLCRSYGDGLAQRRTWEWSA
jgi:hypothetical protein